MSQLHPTKLIGTFTHYTTCRFCLSSNIKPCINLGDMPLAGGFLTTLNNIDSEKFYPLEISFCQNCYLLQSVNVVDKDVLFKDYFYHSSSIKTLTNHFHEVTEEILTETKDSRSPFIVEIGCNDGTLIEELSNNNVQALGVDPADNIVKPLIKKGLPIINNYFTENVAKNIKKTHGQADVICSFNVLAHIEDMHDVFKGITTLLSDDGILIMETHYLGTLLKEMQYDMIYHEHQYYYSLMTLILFFKKFDLEVYDVKPISIHAGSMRYYVKRKKSSKHPISKNVEKLVKQEKEQQLDKLETYLSFNNKLQIVKENLLSLLHELKYHNKKIVGYGASGRGTVIMNYCGLDNTLLDYVVDDAPAKQGAFTPGTHLEIKPSSSLMTDPMTDFAVLFAWSFVDEINKRNAEYIKGGGKFITPLPTVQIVP